VAIKVNNEITVELPKHISYKPHCQTTVMKRKRIIVCDWLLGDHMYMAS